ncbi:MAG: hypothetical protein KKH94_11480 [Candidatus Omnitrophica bacterium]|nr:hypothetical protein [Candidatus Omnitrophota bacterium]
MKLLLLGFIAGILCEWFAVASDRRALKNKREKRAEALLVRIEDMRKVVVPFIRANREAQRLIIMLFMVRQKIKELLNE